VAAYDWCRIQAEEITHTSQGREPGDKHGGCMSVCDTVTDEDYLALQRQALLMAGDLTKATYLINSLREAAESLQVELAKVKAERDDYAQRLVVCAKTIDRLHDIEVRPGTKIAAGLVGRMLVKAEDERDALAAALRGILKAYDDLWAEGIMDWDLRTSVEHARALLGEKG
jgi:hypothetical protein